MSVFVTVGTTKFEELIKAIDTDEVLEALRDQGLTKVLCQIGNGEFTPESEFFRFSPSLDEFMENADLIISHAGAGSILEALRKNKKLIVVVNQKLMDNHQLEIAKELSDRNHLIMCENPDELSSAVRKLETAEIKPLPPSNTQELMQEIVDLLN
ncbi:unnamed protein product [Blepharisma stoltei]|uniref:UDP-N-acetylglucosamine transferase subunit ALG13 n=1 Tax=Blepharisma stoltei TaxID=1481888 RepID=A0AAU9K3Z8_9CILI|nr:unnamed protein product [Blepharisma stoltei]